MLADKAYDADRIRASLREKGASANIRPKPIDGQNRTSAFGSTVSAT